MINIGQSKQRRPNTADTIKLWMHANPEPGLSLIISSQPYVHYQDAVLRAYLPAEFTLEVVGKKARSVVSDGKHLDNLARWLYQEEKLLDNQ